MAENAVPSKGILSFGKSATQGYIPVSLTDTGALNINGSITAALGGFNSTLDTTLASSGTSARKQLTGTGTSVLIDNSAGSTNAHVKFGNSSVVAVTTDAIIPAGRTYMFDSGGQGYVAIVLESGSTTLSISQGTGLFAGVGSGGSGGGGGNVNLNQVGGSAYALGANTKANSMPVTLASDQGNLPVNITQMGGSALALGQTTKSASVPVALASDQGALTVLGTDRTEISGSASSAAVLSNFPVTDTNGARALIVQVTAIAAASTLLVEESNDGTTWTTLTSAGGLSALIATGLYGFSFSAKQVRVRQSVYGGSGTSSVLAELRANAIMHISAIGATADAQATDSTSSWSVVALLKGIRTLLASPLAVTGTFWQATQPVSGTVAATQSGTWNIATLSTITGVSTAFGATASAVPANAGYYGLLAKTALPSAGSDGNLVGAMADKFGRQITRSAPRELLATASINTTGTSGTLLAAQGAGVFADMFRAVIANSSAAAVLVTLSDGTNSYPFEVPANGTVGFSGPACDATPAAAANTAWTFTVASGTTTIYIHAQFILNK